MTQQVYFSTHNALRANNNEEKKFPLCLTELQGTKKVILSIYPFYDCQMVKRLLIQKLDLPKSWNIRDIQLLYYGAEIPNNRLMQIFDKTNKPLYYTFRRNVSDVGIRNTGLKMSKKMDKLVSEINLAFQRNVHPKLTLDGTGSTYRMFNTKGKIVSMFKPLDEEAFAPNNPRGYTGNMGQQGFRSGVLSGEGSIREVATSLWDAYYHNFSGVPETTLLEICHPAFNYNSWDKVLFGWGETFNTSLDMTCEHKSESNTGWKLGALQEFVPSVETVGNYDCSVFSIGDVHKIAILDICLYNLDRNDANILVVPKQSWAMPNRTNISDFTVDGKISKYKLIPIDHGLCLPDVLDLANFDWVWFDWPQCKVPFTKDELNIINHINVDYDADRLKRKLLIRDECLRSMRVSARWLKLAASYKLNLHQIATVLCRSDLEEPSIMENTIQMTLQQAYRAIDATSFISSNRLGLMHIDLATTQVPKFHKSDRTFGNNENKNKDQKLDSNGELDNKLDKKEHLFLPRQYNNQEKQPKQVYDYKSGGSIQSTAYRRLLMLKLAPQNATWTIFDKENKPIDIMWSDGNFEELFFKLLQDKLKEYILEQHPNWESYLSIETYNLREL